jgi:hypothetical protein
MAGCRRADADQRQREAEQYGHGCAYETAGTGLLVIHEATLLDR